ncbi:MAG: Gfo/Idh/MocA family oxidoreductase [Planctomycetes bacterium]|nr:Gfo/Idh/MocA family oxidoreductase [Planctomycetota bacterium]
MAVRKVKVGVIGCGNICAIYLKNMQGLFEILDVVACADLVMEKAEAAAAEYEGVRAVTADKLLADDEIEIVVNLTIPAAHAEVALAAVEAGKSVYNEKPLALERKEGRRLLQTASANGVLVGGAPDTFLGGGLQTCREIIDDGQIGDPVAATAFMTCHGHESWHPAPGFYYKPGGGPMFDMGPYYLTALVSLIGPAERVTGSARITLPQRTITSKPLAGEIIDVEVPTHVAGVMDFQCGAIGTIITSFDVWGAHLPFIEIYGTEGSLSVPDPNTFGGPVRVMKAGGDWRDVALTHGYAENSRGLGVADMACALRSGRPHRACGEMCYHVLDIMHAFHDASDAGRHVSLESTCKRPAPLPHVETQGGHHGG